MKYSYKLVTFLLLFANTVSQAQTLRPAFTLSKIDNRIVKEFKKAWRISGAGVSDVEGLVVLFANPDGSYRAKAMGCTNEAWKVTFSWNSEIIAIVHTHPNRANPKPHGQDLVLADRYAVPIFTITLKGMFMYDPSTKKVSKIKDWLDWLEPAQWTQRQYVAAN